MSKIHLREKKNKIFTKKKIILFWNYPERLFPYHVLRNLAHCVWKCWGVSHCPRIQIKWLIRWQNSFQMTRSSHVHAQLPFFIWPKCHLGKTLWHLESGFSGHRHVSELPKTFRELGHESGDFLLSQKDQNHGQNWNLFRWISSKNSIHSRLYRGQSNPTERIF